MSGANRWTIVAALAVGVLIGSASIARPVVTQESKPGEQGDEENEFRHKKPTEEEMQEMGKRWAVTVAPSKHHRFLEKFLGEWDTSMTTW
ncbi:MAG: hypothetical protein O6952_10720, partial [Planctomycetota bacterium]|nr:hypothetical protein [Planctomycetota bacterium]